MRINSQKCCGCRACELSCPKAAISFQQNDDGFLYPIIDVERCVECGVCTLVCPSLKFDCLKNNPHKVYAAYDKNLMSEIESSSGGLFSVFAREILRSGGVVYGASFDENLVLKHTGIDSEEKLIKLKGSKYLQSNLDDAYVKIRKDLNLGLSVLFCGTPCQVAGLRLFLRKNYDNLFTIDLICHGVPSQKIFDNIVAYINERRKVQLVDFKFRDKRLNRWGCSCSCSYVKNGAKKTIFFDKAMDVYMELFLKGEISRECCYECPFAEKRRVGDISLGDFWGVEECFPTEKFNTGVSAVFLNNLKAVSLFDIVKKSLYYMESSFEQVAKNNAQLKGPVVRPNKRDLLPYVMQNMWSIIDDYSYKNSLLRKIKFYVKCLFVR